MYGLVTCNCRVIRELRIGKDVGRSGLTYFRIKPEDLSGGTEESLKSAQSGWSVFRKDSNALPLNIKLESANHYNMTFS